MLSTGKIAGVASLLTIFGLGTANAADVLVPPPAPAPAANTMTLKISGQVNRSVLYGDSGDSDDIFLTDNDNSGTRFRFVASGRLNDDITAGATIELQFESNSSTDIRFDANGGTGGTLLGTDDRGVGERIGEVWFNSASMGKVSLGQGNTASNGVSETDLSGTGLAQYSLGGGGNEGLEFGGAGAGPTVGSLFTNLDGGSRRDRIRYDTPTFAGFRASTSYSQGGRWDIALRYAGQFAGARVAASIGFDDNESNGGGDTLSGSVSVLLDSGFNVTFAAGDTENDGAGTEQDYLYGKVGFQTNSISMYGRTSFSVDYYTGDVTGAAAATSGDLNSYGLGVVQNLDPIGSQIYLSVRNHEFDDDAGNNLDDVFAAFVGARVQF